MTTHDLHPLLLRNLSLMGYAQPRAIQAVVREPALLGRDVIGLAATGTGKTAAFIAPLLHHLIASRPGDEPASDGGGRRDKRPIRADERIRALVLCPTRELAQQVQKEAGLIAQGSVLRTVCVFGKSAVKPQADAIARGVDLVVATPGRAIELLDAGHLSLAYVRHVVIDEGDRLFDMGFLPQIEKVLSRIGAERQIMIFSATMPPAMEDLARRVLREPVRIELGKHTTPVTHVAQHLVPVRDDHKVSLLLHMLGVDEKNPKRKPVKRSGPPVLGTQGVLVFCRTRRRVGWVGEALERHGIKVGTLHGDRSQSQRQKALQGFREGALRVLVATDVAARGLHIASVKTVINYDLPLQPEEYVHRVGRAAHGLIDETADAGASASGGAYTLLDPEDRMKWRAIIDTTEIKVFAEHEVAGWTPPLPPSARHKKRQSEAAAKKKLLAEAEASIPQRERKGRFDPFNRPPRRRGRSHASKPIKKGQKPGGGVRK